jgi:hypothetical protein
MAMVGVPFHRLTSKLISSAKKHFNIVQCVLCGVCGDLTFNLVIHKIVYVRTYEVHVMATF